MIKITCTLFGVVDIYFLRRGQNLNSTRHASQIWLKVAIERTHTHNEM